MTIPDYFKQLGLSSEKATLYLTLLNSGPQTAISLAKLSGIKRTYVYHLSQELAKENLIKLSQKGRTTFFTALSPDTLLARAEERQTQARLAMAGLESALPELQSKFHLSDAKPAVTYYEGVNGIKKLYQDINSNNQDIILLRSNEDSNDPEVLTLITDQLKRQIELGIHTRAITPLEEDTKETYLNQDKARLVDRHITKNRQFLLPSQIFVYGSKVALTSFKDKLTTIIDNHEINQTFRQIFDLLWKYTEIEHESVVMSWKNHTQSSQPKP